MHKFNTHCQLIDDDINNCLYKHNSVKTGLKEGADLSFGLFRYHNIEFNKVALTEDIELFNKVEFELDRLVEFETHLMSKKLRLIEKDRSDSAWLARDVANTTVKYTREKIARLVAFNLVNEIADIQRTSSDKSLRYGTAVMFKIIDKLNDVTEHLNESDKHTNMTVLMKLRKARMSGNGTKILSALAEMVGLVRGFNK